MAREIIHTELGKEIQCIKCLEFWPADFEFFYRNGAGLHPWCKACHNGDRIARKARNAVSGIMEKTAWHTLLPSWNYRP